MPYVLRDAFGRDHPVNGSVTIGRDPIHSIVLTDTLASRLHATVWEQGGALFLRDENSSNGTYVNQARTQQTQLRPGDEFRIGDTIFLVLATPDSRMTGAAAAISPLPISRPSAAPGASGPTPGLPPTQSYPVQPQAAPPAKRRGCGIWLLAGCLVLILACLVTAGGGYLAYRNGLITANTFLNLAGLGPADIEFDNFRDDTLEVTILQLDVAQDQTPSQGSVEIASFDIHNYHVSSPGRYRVDFGLSYGADDLGSCTLTLKSGDQYQFVTLPERIAVNRANRPSKNGPDFVVETSALCR